MRRTALSTAWVLAAVAAGVFSTGTRSTLLVPAAHAQNIQGMRTVSGSVTSQESDQVPGATVFLRDEKTKTIRSYTTDSKGHFNFAQVAMVDDYDLWAEKDGKKSETKTVSSWDARTDFITSLKLK